MLSAGRKENQAGRGLCRWKGLGVARSRESWEQLKGAQERLRQDDKHEEAGLGPSWRLG